MLHELAATLIAQYQAVCVGLANPCKAHALPHIDKEEHLYINTQGNTRLLPVWCTSNLQIHLHHHALQCASTSTARHLNMSLCNISHVGELHQIPAIANVVFELALPGFGHQGGEEGGIPFSKDTAGPDSTGGQGAIGPIGCQHSPLTLNLQDSHYC